VAGLAFGRFSAAAGSTRFFGFGFSDAGRAASAAASAAFRLPFLASSRRFRLRLSSRLFSRMTLSTKNICHLFPRYHGAL
jgi:hypothetical protein